MMLALENRIREMLTLHTNPHAVHGRSTLKDDCEHEFWNGPFREFKERINDVHEQLRLRTKDGPGVHGPLLWTGSMDHFRGPGPWTPCHGPGPWTLFLDNEK